MGAESGVHLQHWEAAVGQLGARSQEAAAGADRAALAAGN